MKKTRVVSFPEAVRPAPVACESEGGICTRDMSMSEPEYLAGVAIGRKHGVENAWDEPEFVRDMQKWEPHMKVKQVARGNKVTVMVTGWAANGQNGRNGQRRTGMRVRTRYGIATRYYY